VASIRRAKRAPPAKMYGRMFLVEDIARSVKFYRGTLHLKGETTGPWAEFRSGESRLVLLERSFWAKVAGSGTDPPAGAASDAVVLAVQVRNVVRECQRLTSKGVAFDLAPTEVPMMGNWVALPRDPDGYLIELSTML
jgi:lactoylglutathione lyase